MSATLYFNPNVLEDRGVPALTFWKKKQFWGTVIGLLLLAFCVKDIRLDELKELSTRINYLWVLPSIICSFGYAVFRAARWRVIVSKQKKIGLVRVVTLFSAGQVLNQAMPALTGQVGRIFLFSNKEGLRKSFVFSTVILEILFDAVSLITIVVITSLVWPFPDQYRPVSYIVAGATVTGLLLLYAMLHFQEKLDALGRHWLREKHPGTYIAIRKWMRSFTSGIELLQRSQHILGTLLWSLLAWGANMLAIYFLALSFGHPLKIWAAAFVMIVNTLALMVPLTPGNAGTFEIVVSTSLAAFAMPRSDAVLFALALHLIDILPMFLLGFFFMHVERMELNKLRRAHEDESLLDKITEEGTFVEEDEAA
ncbi:MAG: UPF0104 family protein [Candidatus Zixiibacteriota bacterium]|nr:MAG: UPF0104 family protein [candidate division Zixibacteria bacterium]